MMKNENLNIKIVKARTTHMANGTFTVCVFMKVNTSTLDSVHTAQVNDPMFIHYLHNLTAKDSSQTLAIGKNSLLPTSPQGSVGVPYLSPLSHPEA